MSSEEKKKILQMVEDGKVTAEEAMTLIKAIEENSVEDEVEVLEAEAFFGDDTGSSAERSAAPEFEEIKARAQKYIVIPLGIGIFLTVLSAYWMYTLIQNSNYGFWFVFAWFPLLVGILLVALSAGGLNSRWLYVNVDQQEGDWPQHITLGFPLPLGVIGWIMKNFGHFIRGMDNANVDRIIAMLSVTDGLDELLIINVDEGDHGEQVQVYIG
jgi:hypothetical protein